MSSTAMGEVWCLTSQLFPTTTNRLLPHHHTPLLQIPSRPIRPLTLSVRKFPPLLVPLVARTGEGESEAQVVVEEEKETEGTGWENGAEEYEPWQAGPDAAVADVEEGEGEVQGSVDEEESYVEPPEDAKLFVGNLPYDMDSEGLAELFNKAGIVEIAEVIYNRETDQSRGFGFITMSTVEEADKAIEMFNRYDSGGRLLTVNKAAPRGSRPERSPREFEPSFRIYVGNLPWSVDDARLEQVFSEHGKVVDAKVVYDRETGRSRGFGFVTMSTRAEVDDAIAALDGQSLDGRPVRVNIAEERPRRGSF